MFETFQRPPRRDHRVQIILSDRELADLEREGRRDGLVHLDGTADKSAIGRRLIAEAIKARKPD